jgi:hypothetical protein
MYSSIHLEVSTRSKWVSKLHFTDLFTPGTEPRNPLNRRLGGTKSMSGRFWRTDNSLFLPKFEPLSAQLIATRYMFVCARVCAYIFVLHILIRCGGRCVRESCNCVTALHILQIEWTIWNTCLLTNSLEHSISWEANRFSTSQEIPCIWWNSQVHYRIHKCPPPVPVQYITLTRSIPRRRW